MCCYVLAGKLSFARTHQCLAWLHSSMTPCT